jgi:hypothetical protein
MVRSSILNTCIISHAVKYQGKFGYIDFQMKAKEVSFPVTTQNPHHSLHSD